MLAAAGRDAGGPAVDLRRLPWLRPEQVRSGAAGQLAGGEDGRGASGLRLPQVGGVARARRARRRRRVLSPGSSPGRTPRSGGIPPRDDEAIEERGASGASNGALKAGVAALLAAAAGTFLACVMVTIAPRRRRTPPRPKSRPAGAAARCPWRDAGAGALERRRLPKHEPKIDRTEHRKGMPVPDNLLENGEHFGEPVHESRGRPLEIGRCGFVPRANESANESTIPDSPTFLELPGLRDEVTRLDGPSGAVGARTA